MSLGSILIKDCYMCICCFYLLLLYCHQVFVRFPLPEQICLLWSNLSKSRHYHKKDCESSQGFFGVCVFICLFVCLFVLVFL